MTETISRRARRPASAHAIGRATANSKSDATAWPVGARRAAAISRRKMAGAGTAPAVWRDPEDDIFVCRVYRVDIRVDIGPASIGRGAAINASRRPFDS